MRSYGADAQQRDCMGAFHVHTASRRSQYRVISCERSRRMPRYTTHYIAQKRLHNAIWFEMRWPKERSFQAQQVFVISKTLYPKYRVIRSVLWFPLQRIHCILRIKRIIAYNTSSFRPRGLSHNDASLHIQRKSLRQS